MTPEVRDILCSFELLPNEDKRELASEIMRRSLKFDMPPVSDEEFVSIAEQVFLELDRSESPDA